MKDMDKFDELFWEDNSSDIFGNDNYSYYSDVIKNFKGSKKKNYDMFDMVNKPPHYTQGRFEAIDVIEDAVNGAPNQAAAFNQGQVLKYLLRLWHKSNSIEDAKKARWYLNRLIDHLDD